MVCLANTGTYRLLGPAPNGMLAFVPAVIAAVLMLKRRGDANDN